MKKDYEKIDRKRFIQLRNMMEFIGATYGFVGIGLNNYKIGINGVECELLWSTLREKYYYREITI